MEGAYQGISTASQDIDEVKSVPATGQEAKTSKRLPTRRATRKSTRKEGRVQDMLRKKTENTARPLKLSPKNLKKAGGRTAASVSSAPPSQKKQMTYPLHRLLAKLLVAKPNIGFLGLAETNLYPEILDAMAETVDQLYAKKRSRSGAAQMENTAVGGRSAGSQGGRTAALEHTNAKSPAPHPNVVLLCGNPQLRGEDVGRFASKLRSVRSPNGDREPAESVHCIFR